VEAKQGWEGHALVFFLKEGADVVLGILLAERHKQHAACGDHITVNLIFCRTSLSLCGREPRKDNGPHQTGTPRHSRDPSTMLTSWVTPGTD
jgi:hypothetical protein